ncbi:TetR/AcrR family transcriptional regulator [Nitriliruptoraceae bacterium ZYF776]|nr:TetR/AcrR family transcriptional regulator [Profundirhabdus halotolerans]
MRGATDEAEGGLAELERRGDRGHEQPVGVAGEPVGDRDREQPGHGQRQGTAHGDLGRGVDRTVGLAAERYGRPVPNDPAPSVEPPPRARLLRAADELFYGRGIRATGVDAVLDRAQVARNTLYHHFGGKDGLVVAYLEDRDRRWRARWAAAVAAREDPVERLLAVFDALAAWDADEQLSRGCAFLDAEVELPEPTPEVARVVRAYWDHLHAELTELATAADLPDPQVLATDLVLVLRGTLTTFGRAEVPSSGARAREVAARLVASHAVRPAPAEGAADERAGLPGVDRVPPHR